MTPNPTMAEITMLTALIVIARDKCEHDPACRWDSPCPTCFASTMVDQLLVYPQFARFKMHWKVVQRRGINIKVAPTVDGKGGER